MIKSPGAAEHFFHASPTIRKIRIVAPPTHNKKEKKSVKSPPKQKFYAKIKGRNSPPELRPCGKIKPSSCSCAYQ